MPENRIINSGLEEALIPVLAGMRHNGEEQRFELSPLQHSEISQVVQYCRGSGWNCRYERKENGLHYGFPGEPGQEVRHYTKIARKPFASANG